MESALTGRITPTPEDVADAVQVDWDRKLTARTRVLLHNSPLLRIHENDTRRRPELRHYAALPLAMRAVDLIVENMGLPDERNAERVAEHLRPLLVAMDAAAGLKPNGRRHAEMTDLVLGLLRNDDGRREPFVIDYTDFESGQPVRRELSFFIVRAWHHASGRIVLRLSNEALNLYLNAFDHDIESAQAATEAMVADQLRRGKFADAAHSAEVARANSVRYRQKIEAILNETRRDVTRVDWAKEIPGILGEALDYIQERQNVEQTVIQEAQKRFLDLQAEDVKASELARIVTTMRDCRQRHSELHTVLLVARDTFLSEQERQRFALRLRRIQPELMANVLEPLLGLKSRHVDVVLEAAAPAFSGARPVPVFSLANLVAWQLQPRRESNQGVVPIEEVDAAPLEAELAAYSEADHEFVSGLLQALPGRTTLSGLLAYARSLGANTSQCELLTLSIMREYAPPRRVP